MKNYPRFNFSEFAGEAEDQLPDSVALNSEEQDASVTKGQDASEITGADSVVRTITASDVETARNEGYAEGYRLANDENQQKINALQDKYDLHEKLHNQLLAMSEDKTILVQKIDVIKDIVEAITNSLILSLPTSFAELFEKKLLPYISKYLTGDKITIKLHPSKIAECEKILKLSKLSKALKDKIEIIAEDNYADCDCVVMCDNTMFSYNRDELVQEVTNITSKFINNK